MIETIEAAIHEDGEVVLSRRVSLPRRRRAILVILDEKPRIKPKERARGDYDSVLTRQYRKKRDRLKWAFPAAYEFLCGLESRHPELWLDSGKNAHVYWRKHFLMFVKLPGDEPPFRLQLSPRPRWYAMKGMLDASQEIFPLSPVLEAFEDRHGEWAMSLEDGSLEIGEAAPAEFYAAMLAHLDRAIAMLEAS